MKKLVLAFATLISTFSFSQVITVTWNKTNAYKFHGNTAQVPEFASTNAPVFIADGNGRKELDLSLMESRFYQNNIFINVLKIKSVTKTIDRIEIVLLDYNLRTHQPFETYQIIDLKTNISYYSWYYDGEDDITWVYKETGGTIKFK